MIWTKKKPTEPGYYWLRMDSQYAEKNGGVVRLEIFAEQPPRVVKVELADDGLDWDGTELVVLDGPEYDDPITLADLSERFEWSSSPINLPVVAGSCGCAAEPEGKMACYACLPEEKESMGFMYLARRGCGKVSAMSWDDPSWDDGSKEKMLENWQNRGDKVERVERFKGDPMPKWVCESENCKGDCVEPESIAGSALP